MKKKIINLVIKLAVVGLSCFVLFFVVFGFVRTTNNNMYPNVNPGDLAIYYRFDKACNPGDIVVVENDERSDLYRVAACGGDRVEISEFDELLVNGMSLDFERIYAGSMTDEDGNVISPIDFPYTVPASELFLVNDNRDELTDSRAVGAFSAKNIRGRVISILRTRGL